MDLTQPATALLTYLLSALVLAALAWAFYLAGELLGQAWDKIRGRVKSGVLIFVVPRGNRNPPCT